MVGGEEGGHRAAGIALNQERETQNGWCGCREDSGK